MTWAREFRQASAARSATCPVLVGDPVPGDPRQAYDLLTTKQLALTSDEREQLRMFAEFGAAGATEDAARDGMALAAKVPADLLDQIRKVARMDGTMYDAAKLGVRDTSRWLGDQQVLFDALLVQARFAEAEHERIALWLDTLACGLDLAGTELPIQSLVGLITVERALDVADAGWVAALSEQGIERLRIALEAADAATPMRLDLESNLADMVLLVDEADELEPADVGLRSVYQAWQNAFSVKGEAIERVSRLVQQVRAFVAESPESEAWPIRRKRLERLVQVDAASNRDMMFSYLGHVVEAEQSRRECLARLRLLRLELAERAGAELALPDPLGDGSIQVGRQGDLVQFFCDGGSPERRMRTK